MSPRKYTEGEIRLCRIFVAMLFAVGVISGIAGVMTMDRWPSDKSGPSAVAEKPLPEKKAEKNGKGYVNRPLAFLLTGAVFLSLSVAGGLGLRRVIKNRLSDVELDPVSAAQ
jgi:hypothetical protein